MAKRGRSGTMQVLLNGRLVGHLRLASSGAISFAYDPGWLAWEYAMPISLSLPLRDVEVERDGDGVEGLLGRVGLGAIARRFDPGPRLMAILR